MESEHWTFSTHPTGLVLRGTTVHGGVAVTIVSMPADAAEQIVREHQAAISAPSASANEVSEAAQRIVLDAQEIQHLSFTDAVLVAQAVLDTQGREARLREALLGLSGGGSAPCWCARLPHTETCLAARAALATTEDANGG